MRKTKLSNDIILKLEEISAGFLPEKIFNEFLDLIKKEIAGKFFTPSSEANFIRIILGMFDKSSFINDCVKYPHYVEVLIAISINSNYLTDILVRNPEYFYWIVNPSNLNRKFDEDIFKKSLNQNINSYKSLTAKLNFLRSQKRKEILRIGAKDILGIADLKTVTEELSILARNITSVLFEICCKEISLKYNITISENSYCLIALGKLGGNELNYSSDIDLIIFYDDNAKVNSKKEFSEILIETIYLFIEGATAVTPLGYIFRVDFRLRPDGRTAPLTRSLQSYLNYYESRGEDWERQMLLKASFVCGGKNLYKQFHDYLQPFIYPSSFSVSPTEQIRKMKFNIEKYLRDEENIKLQSGGIRDIEFSVQALQLINGGRIKEVRVNNTLEAIISLQAKKLISEAESNSLSSAYSFYRKVEHYLQLMNDTQTHSVPSNGEILEKLSSYLNYKSSKEFKDFVAASRNKVKIIYESIIGKRSGLEIKENKIVNIKFENQNKAEKDFIYLSEGKGLLGQKEFDKNTIEGFAKIEPALIKYLGNSLQPDLVLQNFVRVIRNITFPSIWYNEFLDEKFFISFLHLCEYSQKSIDLFAEDSDLHEYFLTRKVFQKITNETLLKISLKKLLFTLSMQFAIGLISGDKLSATLCKFFYLKIKNISNNNFTNEDSKQIFIAGMGSFSVSEMTFSSDIDLIFGAGNLSRIKDAEKKFQNLLQNLKKEFKPFDVDCRLRPEGKSSQLAWELESYKKYLQNRARVWEFQAFSKMNFILGNKKSYDSLTKYLYEQIKIIDTELVRKEMLDMRKKLYPPSISNNFYVKKSRGGIGDIEFIVQFLLLTNKELFKKELGKGNTKGLSDLNSKFPELIDFEKLKQNYLFLKKLKITNQNIFNISSSFISKDAKKNNIIAKQFGFSSSEEFTKKLNEIIKQNINFYETVFKLWQ